MTTLKAAIPTVIKLQYKQRQLLFLRYILDVIFLAFYFKTKTLSAKKCISNISQCERFNGKIKDNIFFFLTIRRMGT